MEQHSVPQHIASFEFKLFGNLTVRQFVTLAIPMALAAAVFFSGLSTVVRIPLAGAVGLFGLFAALVPIGGRPFDKWVVSFIKAVLSPTQRVWIKETKLPEFLSIVVAPPAAEQHIPESITAQGRERLRNYLRSLPKGEVTPLDVKEQIAVQRLGLAPEPTEGGRLPPPILWPTTSAGLAYGSLPQIQQTAPLTMAQTPSSEQYQGKLEQSLPIITPTHEKATPRITAHAKPYALPGLEKKLKAAQKEETLELVPRLKAQLASEANFMVESVIPIQTPGRGIKLIHGIGKTRARKLHFAPPEGFDLSKLPIRGERRFEISEELKKRFSASPEDLFDKLAPSDSQSKAQTLPKSEPWDISKTPRGINQAASVPKQGQFVPKPKVTTTTAVGVSLKPEEKELTDSQISIAGQASANAVPQATLGYAQIVPLTARPNVITGVISTQAGTPLEKVILIVKDPHGIPVRAFKTNKLGQFLSATPLADGDYTVEIESESYQFRPFTINLKGQVMQPLEVKPEG